MRNQSISHGTFSMPILKSFSFFRWLSIGSCDFQSFISLSPNLPAFLSVNGPSGNHFDFCFSVLAKFANTIGEISDSTERRE
jgi:hypothetical protein